MSFLPEVVSFFITSWLRRQAHGRRHTNILEKQQQLLVTRLRSGEKKSVTKLDVSMIDYFILYLLLALAGVLFFDFKESFLICLYYSTFRSNDRCEESLTGTRSKQTSFRFYHRDLRNISFGIVKGVSSSTAFTSFTSK